MDYLIMRGGRGASSGKSSTTTGNSGRPLSFYDKTSIYKGMPLEEFQNKIRNRKNEWIGIADSNGRIILAGTSYNNGGVAIPVNNAEFKNGSSLTHNHPGGQGQLRGMGGTLSPADVTNHVKLDNIKTTSAVAKERDYFIVGRPNDRNRALSTIAKIDKSWDSQSQKTTKGYIKKSGKSPSWKIREQIYLGAGTRMYRKYMSDVGLTYTERKRKK